MSAKSTVSACLIVKNEATNLPRCLASLRGLVDEIVVVDTGSTDETVSIAESFGAKVGHFTWCDDFAKARNAALDLATSDWVLVIDADEALHITDMAAWQALLGRHATASPVNACIVVQANLDAEGRLESETRALRLFRRRREVRFEGRIHETVLASIQRLGWPLADAPFVRLAHTGYQAEAIAETAKTARNARLAELEVRDRPDDAFAWLNLARSYAFDSRPEAAHEAFQHLFALTADLETLEPLVAGYAVQSAHEVCQRLGKDAEAAELLTRALARIPGHPEFHFERGRLRRRLGDGVGARADFEACLAAHGRDFPIPVRPGLTDALPRQALAELGVDPAAPLDGLKAATRAIARGEWAQAKAHLLGHLEQAPRSAAAFRGLAVALQQLDQPDKALLALGQAIALDAGNPAAYYMLGSVLETLGQPGYAERAYALALRFDPEHPDALTRRLACRQQPTPLALAAPEADALTRLLTPQEPTVSACLIVKNEAKNLPRCLASLRGLVDEIVVVDTGSTDESLAIAGSFGAKVGHFSWCDDFAAARNAALDLATSDWVLVIDADEEIRVDDPLAFRRLLHRWENGAFNLPLGNVDEQGHIDSWSPVLRLFQRQPGVRFAGRLHESVQAGLNALGWPIANAEALRFLHHGYQLAVVVERGKAERNLAIAEAELRERPDDPAAWLSLGRSLQLAGRYAEGLEAFERLDALPGMPEGLASTLYGLYVNCRTYMLQQLGRWSEAEATLTRGLAHLPGFPEFLFERGRSRAAMGDLAGARADFRACLDAHGRDFPLAMRAGLTDALPREALAIIGPARPRVSACLIVKNEATNLPRCLASLRGLVDEIVVVDTGSTDETVSIAESFGAKVGHFTWCDDFAKARNAALDLATSDWVLILDADEEIRVEDPQAWLAAISGAERAYLLPIHNVDAAGLETSVTASFPRLFPRHPQVRFEGRLHESPGASLLAQGWPVAPLPAVWLRHGGYTDDAIAGAGKLERNRQLAERMIADDPTNPDAWHFLASTHWLARDNAATLAALAELRRLQARGRVLPINFQRTAFQVEAWALAAAGRAQEALDVLNAALAVTPGYVEYLYERARVRVTLGDEAGAIADLTACLATPRASVAARQGITGFLSHAELADIHARGGRLDRAAAHLRAAADDPACPAAEAAHMRDLAVRLAPPAPATPPKASASLEGAVAALESGRWADARAQALDFLATRPRSAEGFLALASALMRLDALDKALLALGQAIALDAGVPAAYFLLGQVLDALDQPGYAERAFAATLQLDPNHPHAQRCRLASRGRQPGRPIAPAEAAVLDTMLARLRPTVSACLIVKDEAKNLPKCLESLKGFVDEIVVVDTGSTDESVAIAESFGAKVGHFAWCDDFAVARNAALDLATCDWVLVIDADEALHVTDMAAWLAALRRREAGGYVLTVHNQLDDGEVQTHDLVRLFQRHAGIRYEGRLHEDVTRTIAQLGWGITPLGAAWLSHSGYTKAAVAAKDKWQRNFHLALAEVEAHPEDVVAWYNLGRSALFLGQGDGALAAFAQVERMLAAGAELNESRRATFSTLYTRLLAEAGR